MAGLVTYVSLRDSAGSVVSFGPGDDVPGWAKKQITNPRVWDDFDPDAERAEQPAVGTGGGGDEPPPLGGPGSGRDLWAAYAAGKVEVADDWKRDDIVDALKAKGFRVE
jgi:hypothetical protein